MPNASGLRIGRIFGIPIYIHASWIIIFALITATITGQFKFDHLTPGKYRLGLLGQLASDGESSGQEVTLQEGQMLAVELRANGGAR